MGTLWLALVQADPDGARRMKELLERTDADIAAAYGPQFPWLQVALGLFILSMVIRVYAEWRKRCPRKPA